MKTRNTNDNAGNAEVMQGNYLFKLGAQRI